MTIPHLATLLALGTLCRAWRANFGDATQCQSMRVEWSGIGGELLGPPFVARVAAFGLAPLTIQIPASAWSDSAQAGSYSFDVPWPEGTKYVAAMDDGFGLGTGGVTNIQTVKSSSNSGCISTSITQPEHVFDVYGSFAQCSTVSMNWTEPAANGTIISGLVPSGTAFRLDPPSQGFRSTTWDLNIPTGTSFVLLYTDGSGASLTSSLLLSTGDGSNKNCLASGTYPSATASQTGISEATGTSVNSPAQTSGNNGNERSSSSSLGIILGATFGTLAALVVLGLVLCIWIRRRRYKRVVLQPPTLAKKINLDAEDVQPLEGRSTAPVSRNPGSLAILPFVLPPGSPSMQENNSSPRAAPQGKRSAMRQPSRDTFDASDSSYTYGTDLTANTSTTPAVPHLVRNSDEPMFIRHEDGGAMPPPRAREVIELPPEYNQVPRSQRQVRRVVRPLPQPQAQNSSPPPQ